MSDLFANASYQKLLSRDEQTVTPAVYRYTPLAFERGQGMFLYDIQGKPYLDFTSGMASLPLGHCHPAVVEAVKAQAEKFNHVFNHIGYYEPYVELLEVVQRLMPPGLDNGMGILMNSGSEAVESCLKAARYVTGRQAVICFLRSFHGRSLGALAVTNSKAGYRKSHAALLGGVYYVPFPFSYRFLGRRVSDDEAMSMCQAFMAELLDGILPPDDVAGIIVEPIQGEGGYRVPPDDFLPWLRQLADDMGSLLIADEIQTGIGRTGKNFAFENWGVTPDLVALAKAFGGGLPLSCAFGTKSVMERWNPGSQGSTFGGNPLSIAASLATLKVLREEGLAENALKVGAFLQDALAALAQKKPCIGDVRGRGLLIGAELVDAEGAPAGELAKNLSHKAAEMGLVITTCGSSTLRFAPPLIISQTEAEQAVSILGAALDELGY